jgi:hypothetical protein
LLRGPFAACGNREQREDQDVARIHEISVTRLNS